MDLVDELPLPKVFAGVTTAGVARAAGVTTGSFFHHFATHAEYVDAMVLSILPSPEDLVEQVDELVDSLDHIDLLEVLRLNLKDTWEVNVNEDAFRKGLRFQFHLWAHHDQLLSTTHAEATTVRDVLSESYRIRHDQAVEGWKRLLEMTGRTFIEPFDVDRIAIALTAMFEGLLARHQIDPDVVDDGLFADVAATLATALTMPRGSRMRLADLGIPLIEQTWLSPQARSGARRRRETRLRITHAATGLFDGGFESVPASDVAEAAGVSNQTVLNLFNGVREVAASTFVRHLPALQEVVDETADDDPLVALHRVLSRLIELAASDPEPARALLDERAALKLHLGGELADMDIRLEVPLAQVLLPSVERMDLGGAEPIQVVALLCDTALTLAIDRLGHHGDRAAMAMRMLPPSATGIQPWVPPGRRI
jgi:AcrR family transcriptional regulator